MAKMTKAQAVATDKRRLIFVCAMLLLGVGVVLGKLLHIQLVQRDFLLDQGDRRTIRAQALPAMRGVVYDRNGVPLAISTPMQSLWINPSLWDLDTDDPDLEAELEQQMHALAQDLNMDLALLESRLRTNRQFVWLRRMMVPEEANALLARNYLGLSSRTEYRRYYPAGEVTAHVLGFTNIDGQGLEGLERAFDSVLAPRHGSQLQLRDVRGRVVRDLEEVRPPVDGRDLHLTLDLRLQYLAHRELKQAMQATGAKAASVVVMDPRTGEVLAMANQPSFNPNNRAQLSPEAVRNRAMVDTFEPGSVIKAFTLAEAVDSGKFSPDQTIDTSPGRMQISSHIVSDFRDYGVLDLSGIMAKSSNVGTSKVAIELGYEAMWNTLWRTGFGQPSGIGFPGEMPGSLPNHSSWNDVRVATLSYGYGLQVSTLQLARAYSAIANDGLLPPVGLIQGLPLEPQRQVYQPQTAAAVRDMLAEAIGPNGTARRADLPLYSAGGKTGTVHKVGRSGYIEDSYRSLFVGMAPIDNPALVVAVMIDEPGGNQYYGGEVAAPIFADFMNRALPAVGVAPDRHQNNVAGVIGGQ